MQPKKTRLRKYSSSRVYCREGECGKWSYKGSLEKAVDRGVVRPSCGPYPNRAVVRSPNSNSVSPTFQIKSCGRMTEVWQRRRMTTNCEARQTSGRPFVISFQTQTYRQLAFGQHDQARTHGISSKPSGSLHQQTCSFSCLNSNFLVKPKPQLQAFPLFQGNFRSTGKAEAADACTSRRLSEALP